MNYKLNHKIIKDKCGLVSFKRGQSFVRANQVVFSKYSPNECEATVTSSEDFHVRIKKDEIGQILTECSCPSLSSYQKDCQHIAAVLLSINQHQSNGIAPSDQTSVDLPVQPNQDLTEQVLSLFQSEPTRRHSGRQPHFDNRRILPITFICKITTINDSHHLIGIELIVHSKIIENSREFLFAVKVGKSYELSPSFTYDPRLFCFLPETNEIIHHLIEVVEDEKVMLDTKRDHFHNHSNTQLVIPPSSFERLLPLLSKTQFAKIDHARKKHRLNLATDPLPLQLNMGESEGKGNVLKVDGIQQMEILVDYQLVLVNGHFYLLEKDDCLRLSELKKMLEATGTNQIPITNSQLDFFLEQVVPNLNKLGTVQVAGEISKKVEQAPLKAKLYLDRVNNRLLAGLEFHYGNLVINPVEDQEIRAEVSLIRDVDKENIILQMMDEGSFAKTDSGYFLHNEELEYEFLHDIMPKFQKLVDIYATTAVRNRISKGNFRPQIRVKVKKKRMNWLEFKFKMDLPEDQIREVLQALEEKRKYYRLPNGSLLSLQTQEFDEINRLLLTLPATKDELIEGLNVPFVQGLHLLDSIDDQNLFVIEETFRKFLYELEHPETSIFEIPKSVKPILRDYQKKGFQWMKLLASYNFGGILADDMGLGKTLQSITFILSELSVIREKGQPALIVCPSAVTYNWLAECMKFAPEIEVTVVDGKHAERMRILKNLSATDVMITSYPLLRMDIGSYEKHKFHTVFFDEAQAFKNPITQTAKTVKKINADHRFALTGTPVENALEELWSIYHVVFPELFLGIKEFSQLTRNKISRRIRPFLLRRIKEDVLGELPEKIESIVAVELLPDQKKLYGAYLAKLRHDTLKHLDKDTLRKNKIKILAGLTRLRQICCHPALFVDGYKGSSAKFEKLLEMVEEARQSQRRILIFSQFTKMLALIGRELTIKGHRYFYLDGQTPSEERVELCNRFNAGERDLFLISLKAGGTGLNLTGADTVFLYDLWWNPAVEEQAADRAHRMGQTNIVQVIKLVARGTIEEKMNDLQDQKRQLIEEIIQDGEKRSSALTEEDIRELLRI